MTVIFPGGDFLEFILNRNKNKFLAGNIPVIKSSLFRFFVRWKGRGREEGGERRRGDNRLLCTCRAPDHMQTPQSWTSRLLISALHSVCWREGKRGEKEEDKTEEGKNKKERERERGRRELREREKERNKTPTHHTPHNTTTTQHTKQLITQLITQHNTLMHPHNTQHTTHHSTIDNRP